MNTDNLFDYCVDETITNNSIYFIGPQINNSLFTLCVDNKKIYSYSNEWLYLIKHYYKEHYLHPMYNNILIHYQSINETKINDINLEYKNYNVIPFITSFSLGTTHGYAGLFYMLNEYIKNYDKYKKYNILIYENSQQGLLDIINHFIDKKIIDKNKIIYLSSNIKYLFNTIEFIPNKWHEYNCEVLELIEKYIIDPDLNNSISINNRICIIKSSSSSNITYAGIVNDYYINLFSLNNNLLFLNPSKINEISLINMIYNCKIFVSSWGTAFFKNYIYISEKCEEIIVLVIGYEFMHQYESRKLSNTLLSKYKNATIKYIFANETLDLFNDLSVT